MINIDNLEEFVNGCIDEGIGDCKMSLTYDQIKDICDQHKALEDKYNKSVAVLKETRPYILDQSDWGNKYEARLLEEIDFVLDDK
jgi:hypothetical protein